MNLFDLTDERFDLTDEQLDKIVGGFAANNSNQVNRAFAPTDNVVAFGNNVFQAGSTVDQSNVALQSATNITKIFGWQSNRLFGFLPQQASKGTAALSGECAQTADKSEHE